ncbi:MAG TPA: Xaa-Pro aminopeptidase [Longimicrobium sp.]|nr:Xaa-Pro aminopeptidase [Longimicrobium sp.]
MIFPPRAAAFAAMLLAWAAPSAAQQSAPALAASRDPYVTPALPAPAVVTRDEYARRRGALAARMGDGVLVVFGADDPPDSYLRFAQTPPMQYLAGVTEPGARLVMEKKGGQVRETLFVLPRNPARELWDGTRLGAEGATRLTGIPARPVAGFRAAVDSLLGGGGTLYLLSQFPGDDDEWRHAEAHFAGAVREGHPQLRITLLNAQLNALRASKSPAELDQIRRAALITSLAHRQAMISIRPGMNEFELQAVIEGTFRRNGADRPSFGSIVGSGPNSTTLHYRTADRFMRPGEVVVIDIGASYRGYAADVTRTIPVSGRFSPEQRAVYEVVLAAQKAAEQQARPGGNLVELHMTAAGVIAQGLARLGLIESPQATYDCGEEKEGGCPQASLFFMHGVGHGIGLEVHDPEVSYPPYGGRFTRGSAFTIEPGIYVRADVLDYLPDTPRNRALRAKLGPVVRRYANIGVRIEDNYFITDSGAERITAAAPREVAEIEALIAREGSWNAERRPEIVEWYRAGEAP